MTISTKPISRRNVMKSFGKFTLSSVAVPMSMNLAAMGKAAAFNASDSADDYKALVCIFLYGGNDFANTLVPYDEPSYAEYLAIRKEYSDTGGIALPRADLKNTLLKLSPGPLDSMGRERQFSFNPAMTKMAELFNSGKLAVQLNVGTLVRPLTRQEYESNNRFTYPRPPQLFSHNDQQSVWQSASPEGSTAGWGGAIGDVVMSTDGVNTASSTFTCVSVTGNAVFLSGKQALQYQTTTRGAVKVNAARKSTLVYGSAELSSFIRNLVQSKSQHILENEYSKVTSRSIAAEDKITSALEGSSDLGNGKVKLPVAGEVSFPIDNTLANQLKMVARLISARQTLGVRRQVFFVSLGGFDTHDFLARDHGGFRGENGLVSQGLVGKVSEAIHAFYLATQKMGIADRVTSFTASDFGRALSSNGDGSDHGWGSHHFIIGDAVEGGLYYGMAPPVSVGDLKDGKGNYLPENQWHVGQGRLLPTTSVDQYGATLAKWFGVSKTEMTSVFPNITNFGTSWDSGYMNFMKFR